MKLKEMKTKESARIISRRTVLVNRNRNFVVLD